MQHGFRKYRLPGSGPNGEITVPLEAALDFAPQGGSIIILGPSWSTPSAQAMRRPLAPSAAPIALGATAIASALATQRLSPALDAAALRRTGALTSRP
jgi:hypothetical protein